jgi:outer membrane receptor protein involved in Fe transport
MSKRILFVAIFMVAPLIFSNTALTQEAKSIGIEEILVTAERTAQSIQDVPIAVSAFGAEALELQQIETFGDLQFTIPSVTYTRGNFTGGSMSIRGVASAAVAASGDGAVAYHLDSIPLPTRVFETEFYDVSRVEVLRGPQGTLYGANATAGTVNMIFARPTGETEASAEIEIADYNHKKIKIMMNMPLSDNLRLRVSGMNLSREGFSTNMFPGKEGEDIDGRDITSYRAVLEADLNEDTIARFTYMNFEEDDNRARAGRQMCKMTETPAYGCHPFKFGRDSFQGPGGLNGLLLGAAGMASFSPLDTAPAQPLFGIRETYQAIDPVYKVNEKAYMLAIENTSFENLTIKANFAYHESGILSQQDYSQNDGRTKLFKGTNPFFPNGVLPISGFTDPNTGNFGTMGIFGGSTGGDRDYAFAYDTSYNDNEYKYADITIASDFDGNINFVAGFNMLENETVNLYDVYFNGGDAVALAPILSGARLYPSHYRNLTNPYELERKGVFAQVYFDANEDTRITLGARWNESEKSVADAQQFLNSIILAGGASVGDPVTAAIQRTDPNLGLVFAGLAPPALQPIPAPGEQRALTGNPTSFTEEEITYKAGIDWTPDLELTDSTLIYASVSRGYRPGLFNPPVDPVLFAGVDPQADPEFIDAFEIGMKNVLNDNTLIANFSAFYYDYQGLQVSKIIARTSVNENIDAEMTGFEAELAWSPSQVPGLRIDAQFSLLDTKVANGTSSLNPHDLTGRGIGDTKGWVLKDIGNGSTCGFTKDQLFAGLGGGVLNANPADGALDVYLLPKTLSVNNFDSADPSGTVDPLAQIFGMGALPTLGNCASMVTKLTAAGLGGFYEVEYDLGGNELTNAPKATAHIGIEYTADFTESNLQVISRLDYYWQDAMWTRIYNTKRDVIESWDTINAQVIIKPTNSDFYARLWVQNLGDENNQTGAYFTDPSSGQFRNDFYMEPRMFGISIGAKF